MQNLNTTLNESLEEIASLLPSSSSSTNTVDNQIDSIVKNMEETSANVSTDDTSKSNHCQSENTSTDECQITSTTATTTENTSSDSKPKSQLQSNAESEPTPAAKPEPQPAAEVQTKPEPLKSDAQIKKSIENQASAEPNGEPAKGKVVHLNAPNIETICDDISTTTQEIKRLKHVQVRSNSTGKLYQSSRRVSFPENDSELVTGYLEPADPWACGTYS